MNKTSILFWSHEWGGGEKGKVQYVATEYTTEQDPHSKNAVWTITAVTKHNLNKLGTKVNIAREWEFGWIHINDAIKAKDMVLSGWGEPAIEHMKRMNFTRATIWYPTYRG